MRFDNQRGIVGNYDSGSGRLTLSGNASVDDYQVALRSIIYRFSGRDATNGSSRNQIVLNWSIRNAVREASPAKAAITLLPPPPSLHIDPADNWVDYQAGTAAIPINSYLVVNPSTETLQEATVAISAGFLTGDRLALAPQRGITSLYDASNGRLTLSGRASAADFQTALRAVTYGFAGPDAGAAIANHERKITWLVRSDRQASATTTINIVPPPPPVIRVAGTADYHIGGPGVSIGTELVATSPTGALTGAAVLISEGFRPVDRLNFANRNGITGRFNTTNGELTLSGNAGVADYQSALRSVEYSMSKPDSANPKVADQRKITWTLHNMGVDFGSRDERRQCQAASRAANILCRQCDRLHGWRARGRART